MSLDIAEARAILERDFAPWVRALDLRITGIGPEGARLEMPVSAPLLRAGAILSGQALAALADTAMVFACAGHFGEMRPVATTNLGTRFLRPCSQGPVQSDARVLRAGRSVIFAVAEMIAQPTGKPVASADATFHIA